MKTILPRGTETAFLIASFDPKTGLTTTLEQKSTDNLIYLGSIAKVIWVLAAFSELGNRNPKTERVNITIDDDLQHEIDEFIDHHKDVDPALKFIAKRADLTIKLSDLTYLILGKSSNVGLVWLKQWIQKKNSLLNPADFVQKYVQTILKNSGLSSPAKLTIRGSTKKSKPNDPNTGSVAELFAITKLLVKGDLKKLQISKRCYQEVIDSLRTSAEPTIELTTLLKDKLKPTSCDKAGWWYDPNYTITPNDNDLPQLVKQNNWESYYSFLMFSCAGYYEFAKGTTLICIYNVALPLTKQVATKSDRLYLKLLGEAKTVFLKAFLKKVVQSS